MLCLDRRLFFVPDPENPQGRLRLACVAADTNLSRTARFRKQAGITLVELLVVVGIVAVFMAIVLTVLHEVIRVVQSFRG